MRRHLAPAALLLPAVLVVACSSAPPTESAQATSEDLISCPAGTHADCSGDGPRGQIICTCVQDTGCTFTAPAMPAWMESSTGGISYSAWVAAWAVPSSTGACPVITLPGGRWAEIGQAIGQFDIDSTDDVPMSIGAWIPNEPSDCSQVPGMSAGHCCTYVWWPNGYPKVGANGEPDDVGLPPQDTTNLCLVQGGKNVGLEMYAQYCDAYKDGGSCPVPGAGGCSTCPPVLHP